MLGENPRAVAEARSNGHKSLMYQRYKLAYPYDSKKPTVVLVNSFTASVKLFESQFNNKALTDNMNLLAIEPLGHGQTRCKTENFT